MDDKLMTTNEVAAFLGIPVSTFYAWRYQGKAPRGVKVGKHMRFRRVDVTAWVDAHLERATSDPRPAD